MARDEFTDEYRAKRDFARTPEPSPEDAGAREGGPVFVIHRHDARRLHYDLRLEMEGVLRSWAVPKGFSYDPDEKRLAVRTEDHPIEYEHFHGVIPKGEYGAGSMTIWDRGRYRLAVGEDAPTEVAKGELKILMYGRRLRGEWHLVKTKQDPKAWLLFKSKDRYAGSPRDSSLGIDLFDATQAPMPDRVKFMESGGESGPFSDPEWLFEASFEGKRILAEKKGDAVKLRGVRAGLESIVEGLGALRAENALLDGVLIAQDESERPSAELLEQRLAGKDDGPVTFYAFDLLYYDEFDLRSLPTVDRKAALRAVLPPSVTVQFLDHVPGNGERLVEAVSAAGLRHVVAKRADAVYSAGASDAWVTIDVGGVREVGSVSEGLAESRTPESAPRVRYTNLDKVFWPAEGFTKGDLIAWYESAAEYLLPYLKDRPIHMNRYPDGIEGKSFYQRQAKEDTPEWVTTVAIDSDTHGGEVQQMVCNDRDTLLWLANSGSIDLHPWLSRWGSLESPDWAILDLDPKDAPFTDVIRIARAIGKILHEIGLRPLLKTSGKTGLHVYVPLEPGYTYDHARMFCEGVARVVSRDLKDIATVERVIGSREGKVYVDFGQNRAGQTVVPPYSVRPVRGATVSTPLSWDELDLDLHPSKYTIQTVMKRISERGDLFRGALDDRQDLMPAIAKLEERLGGARDG